MWICLSVFGTPARAVLSLFKVDLTLVSVADLVLPTPALFPAICSSYDMCYADRLRYLSSEKAKSPFDDVNGNPPRLGKARQGKVRATYLPS